MAETLKTPVRVVTFPPWIEREFAPGEMLTLHVDISGLSGPVVLHCEVLNAPDAEIDGSIHRNWQTTNLRGNQQQEADFVIKMPSDRAIVPKIHLMDETGLIRHEVQIDLSLHPTPPPVSRTTIGGSQKKPPKGIEQTRPKPDPPRSDVRTEGTSDPSSDDAVVVKNPQGSRGVRQGPLDNDSQQPRGTISFGSIPDPGNATAQFPIGEARKRAQEANARQVGPDAPTEPYSNPPIPLQKVVDPGAADVDTLDKNRGGRAMIVIPILGVLASAGAVILLGVAFISFWIWFHQPEPKPADPPEPSATEPAPTPDKDPPPAPPEAPEAIADIPFVGPPLPPPPPVKCDWYHDPRYGALTVTDGAGHYLLQCGDKVFAAMQTVCKPKKGCVNEDLVEIDPTTLKPK